jgi:hypothetical protein
VFKRTSRAVLGHESSGQKGFSNPTRCQELEAVSTAIPSLSNQQLENVFTSAADLVGVWREMALRDCSPSSTPASLRRVTKLEERRTLHGT